MTKDKKILATRLMAKLVELNDESPSVEQIRKNVQKVDAEWRAVYPTTEFTELLFERIPAFRELMSN